MERKKRKKREIEKESTCWSSQFDSLTLSAHLFPDRVRVLPDVRRRAVGQRPGGPRAPRLAGGVTFLKCVYILYRSKRKYFPQSIGLGFHSIKVRVRVRIRDGDRVSVRVRVRVGLG